MSQNYISDIREASAVVEEKARTTFTDEIAKHVTPLDQVERDAELKALIEKKDVPGRPRRIVVRKMKNVLFNWKKVLTEAVPALAKTYFAWSANDSGAYLAALNFFKSVRGITEISLSDNHAKAVRFLWVERPSANPVEYEDLSNNMAGKLENIASTRC
ncbi:MAG TPA: hypothetical protein VF544_02215 [Pyrinomonadaceae bacterium]|jgi:hypothetical protein